MIVKRAKVANGHVTIGDEVRIWNGTVGKITKMWRNGIRTLVIVDGDARGLYSTLQIEKA